MKIYVIAATLLFFFAALLFTHSPFGNQPDAVVDESYFLTTALSSIQHYTLPGWDFSPSGTYYGGPEAYLDTAAMVPILGVMFVAHDFSIHNTMRSIALNTGYLLHSLRLINGLIIFCALALLTLFFIRKKFSLEEASALLLFVALILGSSVMALFEHTAKVWVLQLTLDASLGALLIAEEIQTSRGKPPQLSGPRWVALLVWAGVLTFFETYAGAASILLYTIYALFLGRITFRDVFIYLQRWWWLILIFALTQVSFLYRAFYAREQGASATSYLSQMLASGRGVSVPLIHRLLDPPTLAFLSQPLILLYPLLIVLVACSAAYRGALGRSKKMLIIACVHPVVVWAIFYAAFGFSITVRYTGPLIVACAFSIALLTASRSWLMKVSLAGAILLAVLVQLYVGGLWWGSSTGRDIATALANEHLASSTVLAIDPSALTLALPMNARSLALLDAKHQQMGRYAFLLQYPQDPDAAAYFAPVVLYDSTNTPPADANFLITATPSGPPEISTLPVLFSTRELGATYSITPIARQ